MTTSGYIIAILICLLAVSLIVNVWAVRYAAQTEERYLDWIEEIKKERRW